MTERPSMAPHRQWRILLVLIAFALQIPALIVMWALGVSPDWSPMVCTIPAAALVLTGVMRARRP